MAFARVSQAAVQAGRMPRVCMCCGKQAEQLVNHQFYYDPVSLMILGLMLPKLSRYLSGYSSVAMMTPLCGSHKNRFSLMSYLGYAILGVAILFVPLMIYFTYTKQASLQGWMAVLLIPIILLLLAAMLALRLMSPRLVEVRGDSYGFTSVAPEFAAAFGGAAAPTGGFKVRELLIAGGAVGGCAALLLSIGVVMSMWQKGQDDKFFADAKANADANRNQFMEENRQRDEALRNGTFVNDAEKISKMTPAERDAYFRSKSQGRSPTNPVVPPPANTTPEVKPPVVPPVVVPPVVVAPPVDTTNVVEPSVVPPPVEPMPIASKAVRGQPRKQIAAESAGGDAYNPPTMCVLLPSQTRLPVGEEVWALWGAFWYPAVVVETTNEGVKIHYNDYADTFDEVKSWNEIAVDREILAEATRPLTPTNPPQPMVAESRQWADKTGQFKIEGRFVKLEEGKVTILKADGKEIAVPLERLSVPDQEYVSSR